MAKVILITSREIKYDESKAIPLNFIANDGRSTSWESGYLVQFPYFWPDQIMLIKKKSGEYLQKINNAETTDDATKLSKDVVSYVEKANGKPFQLGVFHGKRNDVYVYFAEEYPFDFGYKKFGNDPNRQRYLNSLIVEIENHLKNTLGVTEEVEWQFFSHDKDWCMDASNSVLDKDETIGKVEGKFVSLKEVLSNPKTTIRVFQHITSDDTYLYVKYLIENENLMPSFEDFIEQGKCNKQIFKDYIQDPNNDDNWEKLMKIDTNYPFMPFDIVGNPLKQE